MAVGPYKLTCRPFRDRDYRDVDLYISHPAYVANPLQSIRAFEIMQSDLRTVFEYIEPSDDNAISYSYRIHSLYMRICIEIETNFKTILQENGYSRNDSRDWSMNDYQKLEATHNLSGYEVNIPVWAGDNKRAPFAQWRSNQLLLWWRSYNESKHGRHQEFSKANLSNMIDAFCGLVVVLSAQFYNFDFSLSSAIDASTSALVASRNDPTIGRYDSGFIPAVGGYFNVKFPTDWPEDKKYDFIWKDIKDSLDPSERLFT